MAQAEIKAVITAEDRASAVVGGFGASFGKLAGAMAVGQLAADALSAALSKVVDLTKASVGAAFNQVREVQNATFALKAYESNADKVNAVLKDLVSFARSDMGTLFKREELFSAAQTLKIFGQSTETLTDKVKILAKGSASAGAPIQELAMIIGRAAAKGRLDAVDFDMLIERGVGLDRSMRGAAVTSESLFQALDKALPASLLEGRANTIDGAMIKLESSFRDLGSTILGVDKETSQFIKGGLGDTFMGIIRQLTEALKNPDIKAGLEAIGKGLAALAVGAVNTLGWVFQNILIPIFNYFKEKWPAISQFVSQAWTQYLQPIWNEFVRVLRDELWPALQQLWVALQPYLPMLGVLLVGAIGSFIAGLIVLAKTMNFIIFIVQSVTNEVNKMVAGFRIAGAFVWGFWQGMIQGAQEAVWAIQRIQNAIDKVLGGKNQIAVGIGKLANIPGRAAGGFVNSGQPYMVGEKGPELFVPNNSGKIMPNHAGGGGNTTININVGLMTGSAIERREAAAKMFEDLKVIASQQGQTVGQMIGAA